MTLSNHPERLDAALGRAGRFDVKLSFTQAIPAQARALFLHFYPLSDFTQPADTKLDYAEKKPFVIANQGDLAALANKFVQAVFPTQYNADEKESEVQEVSMAALQGYLLRYKEEPHTAVEHAGSWIKTLDKESLRPVKSVLAPPVTPVAAATPGVGDVPLRKKVLKKTKATAEASPAVD